MSVLEKFKALNGAVVSREEISDVIAMAKMQNNAAIIYRLEKILRNNPDEPIFEIAIKEYPESGLNAPRHKGSYKAALDECGRLRPGYKFQNGSVVKSTFKKPAKKQEKATARPVTKQIPTINQKPIQSKKNPLKKQFIDAAASQNKISFLDKKFEEVIALANMDNDSKESIRKSYKAKMNDYEKLSLIGQIEVNYISKSKKTSKKRNTNPEQLKLLAPVKKSLNAPEQTSDPKQLNTTVVDQQQIAPEVQSEIILKSQNPVISDPQIKTGISNLKELGFTSAADAPDEPKDVFILPGELGKFIQKIQPHKALIIIKGTKHTSKSQLAMQVANAFGEMGKPVAYIDYEQGGMESKDTVDSINRNTTPAGRALIMIKGHLEKPFEELQAFCKHCKVIVADSVTDLGITADQLNTLRCDYVDVIWVFISQVKENGEMYGGNKMAHNPTCIIECHPSNEPKERYATLNKNRGNDLNLQYWIMDKKLKTNTLPAQAAFKFKAIEI